MVVKPSGKPEINTVFLNVKVRHYSLATAAEILCEICLGVFVASPIGMMEVQARWGIQSILTYCIS